MGTEGILCGKVVAMPKHLHRHIVGFHQVDGKLKPAYKTGRGTEAEQARVAGMWSFFGVAVVDVG